MPPLPKRKISSHRQGRRRSKIKLGLIRPSACPHCGQPKLSHRACASCGRYGK